MQNGRGRYIIVYWCYLLAIICVAAMKQGYYKGKSLLAMSGSEYPDVTSSNIRLQYTKMKVHGVWKCNPNRPTKFDEKMLFYAPLVWLSIQVWSSIIYLDTWFTWIVENEMQRALSDGYVISCYRSMFERAGMGAAKFRISVLKGTRSARFYKIG